MTAVLAELDAASTAARPPPRRRSASGRPRSTGWRSGTPTASSGMTATNVARGGFRPAIGAFDLAVDLFAGAVRPAGAAAGPARPRAEARTDAVTAWSVAATQLDQINVDAGSPARLPRGPR